MKNPRTEIYFGICSRAVSDDDRHILPGENTVREKLLAAFLDFGEKGIVVVWIMVGQDQFLDSCKLGALDGLLVAGMAPTAVVGQLLRGELCIVEQEIGPAAEFDRGRVRFSPCSISMQTTMDFLPLTIR